GSLRPDLGRPHGLRDPNRNRPARRAPHHRMGRPVTHVRTRTPRKYPAEKAARAARRTGVDRSRVWDSGRIGPLASCRRLVSCRGVRAIAVAIQWRFRPFGERKGRNTVRKGESQNKQQKQVYTFFHTRNSEAVVDRVKYSEAF